MIGSCDCCDHRNVPVSHFNATAAYPEGVACFICQGETDPDPYGELPEPCSMCGGNATKHRGGCINECALSSKDL